MTPLRDRSTADLVVIILTCVVAVVVIVVTLAVTFEIVRGDSSNAEAVMRSVGNLTGALIALIVGYLAGRGSNGSGGVG
jgi:hypothetical protein